MGVSRRMLLIYLEVGHIQSSPRSAQVLGRTRQPPMLQSIQFYCKVGKSKLVLALEAEERITHQSIGYGYIQWNGWEDSFAA